MPGTTTPSAPCSPAGRTSSLGYSLGGTIAQAIAARLAAEGEEVAFLGLLDTYPPEDQDWGAGAEADIAAEAEREQLGRRRRRRVPRQNRKP